MIEDLFKLIEDSTNVVITAHISADDDSIASVLSTYTILTEKFPNKNFRIVYTGSTRSEYSIFHNFDKIGFVDDIANHVDGTDMLIVLDVNNLNRVSKNPDKLASIKNSVTIDHHASVPDSFTLSFIDKEISSNAEHVYRIFDGHFTLTPELARIFLLGIIGDTGNFSHIKPHQAGVFLIAHKLIEVGNVNIDAFRSSYGGIPKEALPLIKELVKNMEYKSVDGWPPMQISFIPREVVEAGGYTDEDISSASHIYIGQYLTRINGYTWGLVLTPRADRTTRISGRSLPGSVNVRDMFERMQIGGGHDRASGATIDACPKDSTTKILEWMSQNKPLIS